MLTYAIGLLAGGTASSSSESRPRRILDNLEDTAAASISSDLDRMALPSYANSSSTTRTPAAPQDARGFEQDDGYFDSGMSQDEAGPDTDAASELRSFDAEGNPATQQQAASQAARTVSARAANISRQDAFSSLLEDAAPQERRRRYGVRSRRSQNTGSQVASPSAETAGTATSSSQVDRLWQSNGASKSDMPSSSTSAASPFAGLRDRRGKLSQETSATAPDDSVRQSLNGKARNGAAAAEEPSRNGDGGSSSSSSTGNTQSSWYVDWGWDTESSQEQPGPSSQRPARDRQASASASDVSSGSMSNRRRRDRTAAPSTRSKQQANSKGGWWQGFGSQKQDASGDEPADRPSSKAAAERDAFGANGDNGLWETVDDTAPDEPLARPDITRLEPAELVPSFA